eukprot:4702011-Pyramimonas_sp.AAC.1
MRRRRRGRRSRRRPSNNRNPIIGYRGKQRSPSRRGSTQMGVSQSARSCRILQRQPGSHWPGILQSPTDPVCSDPGQQIPDLGPPFHPESFLTAPGL